MGVFASRAAAELAREFGLDTTSTIGTGRDGRITLEDVRKHAPDLPRSPKDLGEAGAKLWRGVQERYELHADGETILLAACRRADELVRLEEKLAATSVTVTGSRNQIRPHPLLAEVRAHSLTISRLLTSIGVDDAAGDIDPRERSQAGRQLAAQRWERRRG